MRNKSQSHWVYRVMSRLPSTEYTWRQKICIDKAKHLCAYVIRLWSQQPKELGPFHEHLPLLAMKCPLTLLTHSFKVDKGGVSCCASVQALPILSTTCWQDERLEKIRKRDTLVLKLLLLILILRKPQMSLLFPILAMPTTTVKTICC